jgi:NAD(P)-dependent dehydrogenase (short-subunit alcohol dehydrogenase family)
MAKAALVTGGGRRVGRAIVLALARSGWDVAVHYDRSREEAEATAAEARGAGVRAAALQADLVAASTAQALVPRAAEAVGPLACLVNNASIFEMDKIDSVTAESWDRHQNVNLRAPLLLSQAFAAQLPAVAAEGNIVNLLDQRVWRLTPYFLSYTVSKTGLWTLTRTLAMALAPRIRVNAIGPGPTLRSTRQTPEQFARQQALTPLGHGASPEEIAEAVLFILGARAMTGQMLALDGGQHLAWRPPDADALNE